MRKLNTQFTLLIIYIKDLEKVLKNSKGYTKNLILNFNHITNAFYFSEFCNEHFLEKKKKSNMQEYIQINTSQSNNI